MDVSSVILSRPICINRCTLMAALAFTVMGFEVSETGG